MTFGSNHLARKLARERLRAAGVPPATTIPELAKLVERAHAATRRTRNEPPLPERIVRRLAGTQ